ncbi:MAG: HAD family hydrolase [Armatimonadetes bacterium]|nr:HAD family hydrolase [Armatimonadota bacterium]
MQKQLKKVIFLDRDGIINKKAPEHQYITKWNEFVFLLDIFEVLIHLSKLNFKIIIISNQQGIGKGILTYKDLDNIHEKMVSVLNENDILIEKIYFCPHLVSDNCNCRKPKTGLIEKAIQELNYEIDFNNSFMIGDSESDIIAGKRIGLKTVLVNKFLNKKKSEANFIVDSLMEIIQII